MVLNSGSGPKDPKDPKDDKDIKDDKEINDNYQAPWRLVVLDVLVVFAVLGCERPADFPKKSSYFFDLER